MRRLFPAVYDSFSPYVSFFCFSAALFFFFVLVVFLVGGRCYTNTRTAEAEGDSRLAIFFSFFSPFFRFFLLNFFLLLNFRFLIFLFSSLLLVYVCLSSNTLLPMRSATMQISNICFVFSLCAFLLLLSIWRFSTFIFCFFYFSFFYFFFCTF